MAIAAARKAYAPYSGFHVGAVVEDELGNLHDGCNLECASIGLSVCAERTAIGRGLSRGARRFVRVWIYTPTSKPTQPCGACREMLRRFSDNPEVVLLCDGRLIRRFRLRELLPNVKGEERRTS
jgi:cytidine deaminase